MDLSIQLFCVHSTLWNAAFAVGVLLRLVPSGSGRTCRIGCRPGVRIAHIGGKSILRSFRHRAVDER